MEDSIQNLIQKAKNISQQKPLDETQLVNALQQLQEKADSLENEDYSFFGYIKYIIAEIYMNNLVLQESQQAKYKHQLKRFKEYYEEILKNQSSECQQIQDQKDNSLANDQMNCLSSSENDETGDNKDLKDKRVYLILGANGVGKSSFVKEITGDSNVEIGNNQDPKTLQCKLFHNSEQIFIDTPGINEIKRNRNSYENILTIVKYLHMKKIHPKDIFIIYIINNNLTTHLNSLSTLAYIYFLYEVLEGNITSSEVDKLISEYFQSSYLLNWQECRLNQLQDELSPKRLIIFSNKDKASNYFQLFSIHHILVKTFFDRKSKIELQVVNTYKMENLKEQIWSNNYLNTNLMEYKDYINNQKTHLFQKINKIIQIEEENQNWSQDQAVQNILLLGKSQIGKSSLIEQITSYKGLRGQGEQSKTQVCQMFPITFRNVRYRFIDTPGYDDTEVNQQPFQNLKKVADYLNRNNINQFKILFLRDTETNVRDNKEMVLKQFYDYIQKIKNPNYSDMKVDCTIDLSFQQTFRGVFQDYLFNQIRQQILEIDIISIDKKNQSDSSSVRTIKFKFNYFQNQNEITEVDSNEDIQQKNTLFNAINLIVPIQMDDQIQLMIKLINSIKTIETQEQYDLFYENIAKQYQQVYDIQEQIKNAEQDESQQVEMLILKRQKILQDLDSQSFAMAKKLTINQHKSSLQQINYLKQNKIIDIVKLKQPQINNNNVNLQIKDEIQEKNNQKEELQQYEFNKNKKLEQDIQKHFFTLDFKPILFETEITSMNIIISRKQHYFWKYNHQLKSFYNQESDKQTQILEDLSKIMLIKEIALSKFEQKIPQVTQVKYPTFFKQGLFQKVKDYFQKKNTVFEQVIEEFLENILDDNILPNQSLLYFQKNDFLSKQYNYDSNSEDDKRKDYGLFKLQEVKDIQNNGMLNQLFKCSEEQNQLTDIISQYLIQNIIFYKFKIPFMVTQNNQENLEIIKKQIEFNNSIIINYFNGITSEAITNLNNSYNKLMKFIEQILNKPIISYFNCKQRLSEDEWNPAIQEYLKNLNELKKQIKSYCNSQSMKFDYEQMRKNEYLSNLINFYCSLIINKTKYLYNQKLISDLKQVKGKEHFVINNSNTPIDKYLQLEDKNKFAELINLIDLCDQYINNRYLQMIKGADHLILSYMSEKELLNYNLEKEIDLHNLAQEATNLENFIQETKKNIQYQQVSSSILTRLENFFNSFQQLKIILS